MLAVSHAKQKIDRTLATLKKGKSCVKKFYSFLSIVPIFLARIVVLLQALNTSLRKPVACFNKGSKPGKQKWVTSGITGSTWISNGLGIKKRKRKSQKHSITQLKITLKRSRMNKNRHMIEFLALSSQQLLFKWKIDIHFKWFTFGFLCCFCLINYLFVCLFISLTFILFYLFVSLLLCQILFLGSPV